MNHSEQEFTPIWAAGFMSGTSLDAVDAAMILTDGVRVLEFGPVAERKYTPEERAVLQDAVTRARDWNWQGDPPDFSDAMKVLTATHIDAFEAMLEGWDGPRPAIAGVHGQTVLHRRPKDGAMGATLQILDAATLQAGLDVPLAYDFRSADVAAGGEGAPLAPIYHQALLARTGYENAAALNLGGVANITICEADGHMTAFDTGPANGPIDEWIERHGRGTYDNGGALAAAGRVDEGLLAQLLDHPYFDERPPKSLDRYDFNGDLVDGLSLEDGAATLTALSARAVACGFEHAGTEPQQLIVCGGGRHNPVLMALLEKACPCDVLSAEAAGWRGDSIEAEAFAYLAVRTLRGLPISFPSTTGAPEAMGGGVLNKGKT
ncbi:MAG: anhydro-N-acetylmuramic acid kinase [Hyphomonadaceae bacterium]